MWIVSTNQGQAVPKANGSSPENPFTPETTTLADGDSTVPMATNHCKHVTIFAQCTGAGSVEIYTRPNETAPWPATPLDVLTAAGADTVTNRYDGPIGQMKAKAVGTSVVVSAEGQR